LRLEVGQPCGGFRMSFVLRLGAGVAVLKAASNLFELGGQRRRPGLGLLPTSLGPLGTRSQLGRRLGRDRLELSDASLRGLQLFPHLLRLRSGLLLATPGLGHLSGESVGLPLGGDHVVGCCAQSHLGVLDRSLALGDLLLELGDPGLGVREAGPKLLGLRQRVPARPLGLLRLSPEALVFRSHTLRVGRRSLESGFDGLQLGDARLRGLQ
jgi:hypothetical protein